MSRAASSDYINESFLPLLLFSLALFGTSTPPPTSTSSTPANEQCFTAFWLRSSVVSVLFSLISEMVLYGSSFINLIFAFRGLATALAHVGSHCVTGIALPPVDATSVFQCSSGCKRENAGKQTVASHNVSTVSLVLQCLHSTRLVCLSSLLWTLRESTTDQSRAILGSYHQSFAARPSSRNP
jgi:hypothetical protein